MPYTLDQLAADCHAAIDSDNGPDGREAVRRHLEAALSDGAFVAAHFGPDNSSPRKLLYQDPDYGFCILAHVYEGAKGSNPHDHGPSWAIYGQAEGVTEMTEWRKLKAPEGDEPGTGRGGPGLQPRTRHGGLLQRGRPALAAARRGARTRRGSSASRASTSKGNVGRDRYLPA